MEIVSSEQLDSGILERRFTVAGANGRVVPGVLWTRAAGTISPLILVGHGGTQHKAAPPVLDTRDYFTGRRGIGTAAIDGPAHGERAAGSSMAEIWRDDPLVIDDMVADWTCTLDALLSLGEFDPEAVGYWGLSMGTMLGLPYVATDPRIAAAVLGLCGVLPGGGTFPGSAEFFQRSVSRVAADAPRLSCPIVYQMQWDDELFDRTGALELYGLIGSADKRLQSTPGGHGGMSADARETLRAFLAARLLRETVAR